MVPASKARAGAEDPEGGPQLAPKGHRGRGLRAIGQLARLEELSRMNQWKVISDFRPIPFPTNNA